MIVRIMSRGQSFSGLATYLTHDAERAKTNERVAWTHTLNLASDDVPCAVNEMYLTAENAELLKQEAGIRAGGRATENPVKHLSLNWAPDEHPTREHMIETTEDFLRHMKWQEHQAVLVAHSDKHPHVHVMLNVIHPETGLRLDDDFERRRAQAWALEYERAHDRIYCQQRLRNPEEREKEMPRNIWEAFHDSQREFENSEKIQRENDPIILDPVKNRKNSEWEILKEFQRLERVEHFNSGKAEFKERRNSIYREVREEFRERWGDYYEACRNGGDFDDLTARKAKLTAEQKEILGPRRDEACAELRAARDERYRDLLDDQKAIRSELRWCQELGLDNAAFLNEAGTPDAARDIGTSFRNAGNEVTRSPGGGEYETTAEIDAAPGDAEPAAPRGRGGDDIGFRSPFSVGSVFGSLASYLLNGGSPPPPPRQPTNRDLFLAAAEDTAKREQREREEAEEEARQKQRSPQ
jgi:hypothetical protein